MPEFFIANPADTDFPFSEDWEVSQWTAESGATITVSRDTSDPDRSSIMKVVSDTEGKGVTYTVETVFESTKYAFSLAYKVDGDQEIDYVIYDDSNSGNIQTGTLVESSGEWSYHYEEITTPANCIQVTIYLRAGDSGGAAFYVDDLKLLGNVLETDPDDIEPNYRKGGSAKRTIDGTVRSDNSLTTVDFSLLFPRLTSQGFGRLLDLHKARKETYFDDQAIPLMVQNETVYTETQYTFAGITQGSGPHYAYEDKSASEPSAQGDFETTEIATADYQVLDDDDNNSYQDSASTTGHYQYHKFVFDCSSEYTNAADVRSFEVTYKGASNDASPSNQDGVTLYAWNVNAGNWVKLGATRVSTKETITQSLMKPEQAQMFVDTANGEINILVQSNGAKGAGSALTLDSYYVEVTVNKSRSDTITLLNRAQLSSGRIVHAKNLSDRLTLALGPDYRIGADGDSVIADGVYASIPGTLHFTGGDVLDGTTMDILLVMWIRRNGNPPTNEYLIAKYDGSTGYGMYIDPSGRLQGLIADASGLVDSTNDGASICDNLWHCVGVIFDRSGNMARYVDGVAYGSVDDISAKSATVNNAADLRIGASSIGTLQFQGDLCHVRHKVGGTLQTAAQMLWIYNHGRDYSSQSWTLDGLTRVYWKFDDAASAANGDADGMITDNSGSGFHLDAVNGTTTNYGTHSRALSADSGDVVEVRYDQYYRVASEALAERRQKAGGAPTAPPRSGTLQLRGLIGLE